MAFFTIAFFTMVFIMMLFFYDGVFYDGVYYDGVFYDGVFYDGVFYDDEDGFKTSFEIAVDTIGTHPDDDPNNIANKVHDINGSFISSLAALKMM